MLIEELIEKAFCDGYEYAQKEFASIRKATKIAKRASKDAYDLSRGSDLGGKSLLRRTSGLAKAAKNKIPTEKAMDRVASVVMNTIGKRAAKDVGERFDKGAMRETRKAIINQGLEKAKEVY